MICCVKQNSIIKIAKLKLNKLKRICKWTSHFKLNQHLGYCYAYNYVNVY